MDEDSDVSFEEDLILSAPPKLFVWKNELKVDYGILVKVKLEEGNPRNTKEAIKELQAALGDLEGMMVEACCDSCDDALEVLTHIGYSVGEIVAAINRINRQGHHWVSEIGDADVLREDSGYQTSSLVEVVAKALGNQVAHSKDLLGDSRS